MSYENFKFHAGYMLLVAVVFLVLVLVFPEKAGAATCIVPLFIAAAGFYALGDRIRAYLEGRQKW